MASEAQITPAMVQVLQEFLSDVSQPRYGYDLMLATGLASGKVYVVLARLQRAGWLIRSPEGITAQQAGRSPRYVYRLSSSGAESVRRELARLSSRPAGSPRRLLPQPQGGWA